VKVLIVDDEANLRRMLRSLLEQNGYQVAEAGSAEQGLTLVGESAPDVVLLDLVLPGASGLESLPRFREEFPGTPIIMMSGEASLADAVRATREGAFHFLEKPLSSEAVIVTLRGALEVSRARALSRSLQEELGASAPLIGASPAMERVRETIRRVAPTDARVLIVGESGTGKELAASAIHELSARKDRPFVRVNSAAIPRELVESEMFGYERGAFTGATARRLGRFELAHGGTLFLDEVGDLGADAQGKLLRVLESGALERLGGHDPIQVDVRVVAATNRTLRRDVAAGRFREGSGSMWYLCACHPFGSARRTCPPWWTTFGNAFAAGTGSPCRRYQPPLWTSWPHIPGQATSASSSISWSDCRSSIPGLA
jgi:two-component system nitrogen regulation response regulator NtrX